MESERDYLQRRAREENDAADRASSDKARDLHLELAARYRDAAELRLQTHKPDPAPSRPGLPLDFRILE